ncbi:MAG: MOSC domain-containing protein [Chloroflexi bacterium]|nr:MOSC domain-containing protein [Chloroflexota bacterium]MCI0649805.1 MOSC domain-containing protein [Chloroflexota bacterium]MCI0730514.1 MOSC domain-containing protein [Chloroflexota bacterium]
MNGSITNIYLKKKHGLPMQTVVEATAVGGKGLSGDVSYGRGKRQVLFIEKETLDEFELAPGQVRENVTVTGIRLASLPAGTRLQVGEALLEVVGDCAPCQFIEDIRPGLQAAMTGRRGTLCRVLSGGTLRVQDAVTVVE